jgi:hypothetical protein
MSDLKYAMTWRNKWITAGATSIDNFIETLERITEMFRKWKAFGIELNDTGGVADDYAEFITEDMDTAIKAGFTFHQGGDKSIAYLEMNNGDVVEVPRDKLKK